MIKYKIAGIWQSLALILRLGIQLTICSLIKFRDRIGFYPFSATSVGIEVKLQDGAYTTQTCPQCGNRYKPKNRNYKCSECGFEYHRDGVGAINIWKKYLEVSQVEGEFAAGQLLSCLIA